jgi:hypothetical protein
MHKCASLYFSKQNSSKQSSSKEKRLEAFLLASLLSFGNKNI